MYHVVTRAQRHKRRINMANVYQFSNEDVINAYQNEPSLWNLEVNATEEEKELAWRRMCDLFSQKSAGKFLY